MLTACSQAVGACIGGESGNPEWSADGKWIIFSSNASGDSDIYRIRPDGTGVENLTQHGATEMHPAWLPDGGFLFDSDRSGDFDIYRADASGKSITRLAPVDA